MNEKDYVESFQKGDKIAFGNLYDLYSEKIYNFIYFRTNHKQTAEDLTSETFAKALKHISTFSSDKGSFSSWLYKIAKNNVIDYFRTLKPTENIETIWDLSSDTNIEQDVENKIRIDRAKKYINALPKEKREILIMRLWDDMTYQDIAEVTGKSEATCKMTFSRAIRELREAFIIILFIVFQIYN